MPHPDLRDSQSCFNYLVRIAHSFKVALGVGYCARQSYCLVVAQANHCSGFRMQKCPCNCHFKIPSAIFIKLRQSLSRG